ncbi:phosphate/phosphite/phosphonate ABC transporter substrate-binding protein [Pseudomonas azotifigens]|uniref:Phosphate/phosphite/phosphonate ABC transporter substrate-binding protein n=2 Tax=Stutzerimonas azotifigens TaxID=291995 RepID=A0ABR5YZI6_9GAMM|nr:phosphate/phosphite/phosphonate ABC transporter substrate-binding protein [Stutzerimonas azotifigens]
MVCFASLAQAETVKLAVTDLVGLEELQREFGAFKNELAKVTGYEIEFLPVTNRTAAVEALRFNKVDFVLTGPAEYVVMQKRANARIVVGLSRPDYFATIITMADGPYGTVADLKGSKVGFGEVGSTSKHLGPIQALADAGLEPQRDVQIVNTKIPVLWEALKRGDVAAIGMNHQNFLSLRQQEMEKGGLQPGAFRVIARGPDLPHDVLMAGSHVDDKVVTVIRQAFVEHSDALIAAILTGKDNQKYSGMRFITNVKDSQYQYVRSMYATAGFPEYADFIGD